MADMRPEDVPDEFVTAMWTAALDTPLNILRDERIRHLLAAVLPLREEQVRERQLAELDDLGAEWGVRGFLNVLGNITDVPMPEADARDCIEDCRKLGHDMTTRLLITRDRYATPWRVVSVDAIDGGRT